MLCSNCSKLALSNSNKNCSRCKAVINNNLSVICDACSANGKQCSVCLKKIVSQQARNAGRGCGCGKK